MPHNWEQPFDGNRAKAKEKNFFFQYFWFFVQKRKEWEIRKQHKIQYNK